MSDSATPSCASVHGILQARILEWVAISYDGESSQSRDQIHVSYISCIGGCFFATSATLEAFITSTEYVMMCPF